MANQKNQKIKLLALETIFRNETDANHGLSMVELLDKLAERGIDAERKSVYTCIEALRESGMNIEKHNGATVTYHFANRSFATQEVLMIVDAIRSSSFLSAEAANALVDKVTRFACEPMRSRITEHAQLVSFPKSINDEAINNIDILMRAYHAQKKITFRYFYYNKAGKPALCRNGAAYTATPLQLVYSGGRYYLVAFDDDLHELVNYRVDHMLKLAASSEDRAVNDITRSYKAEPLDSARFNMNRGEVIPVTLIVKERAVNSVIDKFGNDVTFSPEAGDATCCHVRVVNCPAFYGWLLEQGTGVVVKKPQRVIDTYRAYLRASLNLYDA